MNLLTHENKKQTADGPASAVLELTVRNHPGVMSHVCGLFSRRGFNVESILCMPLAERKFSRIWLQVNEDERLDQIVRQLSKLHDVLGVRRRPADEQVFEKMRELFPFS